MRAYNGADIAGHCEGRMLNANAIEVPEWPIAGRLLISQGKILNPFITAVRALQIQKDYSGEIYLANVVSSPWFSEMPV